MSLRKLKKGDKIGLIATGSPIDSDRYERGVEYLEELGYQTLCPFDACGKEQDGFFAASAKKRAESFMALVEDQSVAAILSVRGGYGTQDILPFLDFKKIAAAKKAIIGFSDFTSLLVNIVERAKISAIHGPNLYQLAEYASSFDLLASKSLESFQTALSGVENSKNLELEVIREGKAEGELLVGNLSVLCSLLGTPWDVPYDGKILILEDVNEKPYRVHRMLRQLESAGKFNKLAGLIYAEFSQVDDTQEKIMQAVFDNSVPDFFSSGTFPVLKAAPLGHGEVNVSLVIGEKVSIEGNVLKVK